MVIPHCEYRTFSCEGCPGCPRPSEPSPVPPALFAVEMSGFWEVLCRCELVDPGFGRDLGMSQEPGRDVMLSAGSRIPARNASVDGTC